MTASAAGASGRTVPSSAAGALYELLGRLAGTSEPTLLARWQGVLDSSDPGDVARGHAAGVGLLERTIAETAALKQRDRYGRYFSHWWSALIAPDVGWGTHGGPPFQVLSDEQFDILAGCVDAVEALQPHHTMKGTDAVTALMAMALRWRTFLLEEDLEFGPGLQAQILGQLEHLLWLLNKADVFGVPLTQARAALQQVQDIGPRVPTRQRSKFRGMLVGSLALLSVLSGASTNVDDTITHLAHSVDVAECEAAKTASLDFYRQCTADTAVRPPEIESRPTPPQLAPGHSSLTGP